MSSIQERKFFLQLWRLVTGPAIDVMHLYFEVKILNNTEFKKFLNDQNNMHQLFHQCFPTIPCCKCATISLASTRKKGCLILQQFEKLYDNSGLPQPNHENVIRSKILQHCLCKYSAKSTVTVDELDITLFYNVVQHCCPSKMNFIWRKNIKDVRNFLAHVANGQVEKASFEDNWKKVNDATLGFAGEISNKCRKMTQEVILEIENSPIEVLKDKLKKSNEDLMKMLDTLNGIKQSTVDECKKTVDLINNKQDENFNKLQSSFSNICKSDEILKEAGENKIEMHKLTSEFQEVKQKINHMDTIKVENLATIISIAVEKVLEKTKRKTSADDNRKITVATQVDCSSLDEEKTIRNISNTITTKIDKQSCCTETFHIKNVEHKCIQLDLIAFPDVFKTPHKLRRALQSLVHRLVEAGEINTKISGKLEINLTVKTPLTKDEIDVVHAVFDKSETFKEEITGEGIDVNPDIYNGISLIQTLKTDPDHFDKSKLKSEVKHIDDCTIIKKVKMEITNEGKYEDIFIAVDNLKCLLKITGLPNDLLHTAPEEQSSDVKGNTLLYVEWTMKCPLKWNVALIASSISANLYSFHDEFFVDHVYSERSSKLIIHTTAQRCVFRFFSTLEVAVKNLIGKIINVSSMTSTEPEELSASVLIMTKPEDEEFHGDEFNKEVKTDQSIFGLKDNIVTCDHCTKDFSCKKCTSKLNHIKRQDKALKMKDQTIQRLEMALTKNEEEMNDENKFDHESEYSVEKNTINESPDEEKRNLSAEIVMCEEPEQKKRKTAITSNIAYSKDASKSLDKNGSLILVDVKQALQKLAEIPLVDYYIQVYRKYFKDLNKKWFPTRYYHSEQIKPKSEEAKLDNLLKEKKKRTDLIEKLKDVIHNQDEFTTTDKAFCTDLQFLNVGNPAKKCNSCHTTEESQIACFCDDCKIFICNNCGIEHRMKNKKHCYFYPSKLLRDYKPTNSWGNYLRIIDMKFVNADIVAILQHDTLCTYNLIGGLIHTFSLGMFQDNSRIACINESKIAVTVPNYNLIEISTIIVPNAITELKTPEGTTMTGGITCRMGILYVSFSDAIRLMELSGQIQRVMDIPSVNLLNSVNNDKMLCVYYKNHAGKTMSCLDFTSDRLYDFERFPFHPEDVTSDDIDNMIFIENGVIWQADSDGKNIKIMISGDSYQLFKRFTYHKDSKVLLTYQNHYGGVKVYRKLQ